MIKFFRHIRRKLLKENRMGKYFKYAIGEIILVMIGILLALQVNNWNNKRIDAKRETNYIKNIERDLNNQLNAIEIQMDFEKEVVKYANAALKHYNETNTLKIDSTFAVALGAITTRRTFLNPNPAYTELISSGNIALLKNEGFKDQLINYYEELERIEKVIDGNNSLYVDQEFIPTTLQLGVLDAREEWNNIFRNYKRQFSSPNPLNDKNMKRLLGISSRLLENEANELLFINHLSSREGYAMVHIFLLLEFKVQTNDLLKALNAYYD